MLSSIAYFRTRQLWFILKVAIIAIQVAAAAADRPPRTHPSEALRVVVTQVIRVKPDLVEIHVTLENKTDVDLYFPTYGTGESGGIQTLGVLHWEKDRGWLPLGPFFDTAPDRAMQLHPREAYTLVLRLQDPAIIPLPGEGIPLRKGQSVPLCGKNRIQVGCYRGEAEWRAYRNYVESFGRKPEGKKKSGSPPQLKFADSVQFDIPSANP